MRLERWIANLAGTVFLTLTACDEPADTTYVGGASPQSASALPSDEPDASPNATRAPDDGEFLLTVKKTDVPAHAHLAEMAEKSAKLPAIVAAINGQLALPDDVAVTFQDCPTPSATYARTKNAITICYGYLENTEAALAKLAGMRAGSPPMLDRVENAMAFVLLHMMGHALVGELHLPTAGGEEGAADDVAALTLLRGANVKLLADAISAYQAYGTVSNELAGDEHAPGEQRFADLACLPYAYDPRPCPQLAPRDPAKRCRVELGRKTGAWLAMRAEHRRVRHEEPPTFADLGDARAISLGDAPIEPQKEPVALDIANTGLRITMPAGWSVTRAETWWLLRSPTDKARFAVAEGNDEVARRGGTNVLMLLGGRPARLKEPAPITVGRARWKGTSVRGTVGNDWETLSIAIDKGDGRSLATLLATRRGASEEEELEARRILGSLRLAK
ncbi:MAG: hypothetical protein HOV80_27765 [Polyangiaceae bacterium]|nr:hypothetical protein [Polyangiaceae bacterium]